MNKKIARYLCFTFLFATILMAISKTSYAEDTIKEIKLAELHTLLESNKGKVIILNLWATWCAPCRKEIPGFISLYKKYKDKGLEIIGITFDENGSKVVPPFIKKLNINYPIYLSGGDIGPAYNLEAYPTTIIYNKDGSMVNQHTGYVSEQELEDELSTLLKDQQK
ncbi:MAG: TlpA disulfide reductase family protein [Candidatus Jettenia sp. CY-1]|nr:MAG: TlpA disulfide reductase family protein [Candidatus Jettenia sp. CY-1]